MEEKDEVTDLEFTWGKKRGVGGKKKEVQFYESFTYDGVEYSLYDCVYMHREGEPEPYIGKLVKIWENADKTKKVKLQWFFRPSEISSWLGDEKTLEKEIFLATGEGVGLANVNLLEAIAGKSNVVCISKDSRNPQPSEEELKMADYIFYRTFDVGLCVIFDKLDDKVGGLEIKYVFNREEIKGDSGMPRLVLDEKDENKIAIACNSGQLISIENTPDECKPVETFGDHHQSVAANDVTDLSVKCEYASEVKLGPGSGVAMTSLGTTGIQQASTLGLQMTGCIDTLKDESGTVIDGMEKVEEKPKSSHDANFSEDRSPKKARIDNSIKSPLGKSIGSTPKLNSQSNGVKAASTSAAAEVRTKPKNCQDLQGKDETVKSARESDEGRPSNKTKVDCSIKKKNSNNIQKVRIYDGNNAKELVKSGSLDEAVNSSRESDEDKPSKKAKVDCSIKEKNSKNIQKVRTYVENNAKESLKSGSDGEATKSNKAMDSVGPKSPSNKEKHDEMTRKVPNSKLPKVSASDPAHKERKTEGKTFEVTRRPDAERSKWFKPLPWEERVRSAHEEGTLVLLLNLDPRYVSGEVEDIIWHAFDENCSAKMVQRTTMSSPHTGQAIVIFKSKEAAEKILKGLCEGCLMLPNGRPLVGMSGPPPSFQGKQSTYNGHFVMDNRLQSQREMKEAVSTSHCAQPNTIEYDMAMDWCLLQARSDYWWTRLYKQQGQDLRKLKASLKSN